MTKHPLHPRSEKGIALIVVLLLLGVMAALTTGLALNGQTEVAMSRNETNYAGARAAAEAGMNRAVNQILADTSTDLLATGTIPNIGNGPFTLNTQYTYQFEIRDDDDPALYPQALTPGQLAQMGEDGDPDNDVNTRMIVRSIGNGPNGTTVIVSRVLQSTEIPDLPETTTMISNPAILVNGDLDISGNSKIQGLRGNVHANGDITGGGSVTITGDATATGDVSDGLHPGGLKAGNMPPIAVPEIKASDYFNLADYILASDGTIRVASTGDVCTKSCPTGWSFGAGAWSASGAMPTSATYYVQGPVSVHGTGKSVMTALSIIAEGSITLTGNGKFKPENGAGIQFVTNGDFELGGTVDADDSVDMDGQIMVREQMKIFGNSEFQGRVMVEDRDSASNAYDAVSNPNGRKGSNNVDANTLNGNMTVTYNGHLGDIVTTIELPAGPSTYTNNISGWLEQ
jgi:type II secretory pathway pseudopilin PulG